MIARRRRYALSIALFAALPFAAVQACGPDWEPDTFVRTTLPDDHHAFARGRLGILQSGYDSNELAVAYRYLNGGKLSDVERLAYDPPPAPVKDERNWTSEQIQAARDAEAAADPVNVWRKARATYLPAASPAAPALPENYSIDAYYYDPAEQRCPVAAFVNATLTLNQRATAWGKKSAELIDWIRGQDAVFANCSGKTPIAPSAAPPESRKSLTADRAYQSAAAAFYAGQFDEAQARFAAIARDAISPWRSWGGYLAARALVRKAFAHAPRTEAFSTYDNVAQFDPSIMKQAQSALESLAADRDPSLPKVAIRAELNFVRMRTEPDKRIAEVCDALAGPAPDPNFAQDLQDLNYILVKHIESKDPPPLLQWIRDYRSDAAGQSAFAIWQQRHEVAWLVLALMKAKAPGDDPAAHMLDAAASIKPGTPAYDTVTFHRIRLLTATGLTKEARTLLDQILPTLRREPPDSRLNAFLAERMAVATSFDEFLQFAPRTMLESNSPGAGAILWNCYPGSVVNGAAAPCEHPERKLEFDSDAAVVFNRDLPLSMLVQAASSTALPPHLRQDLALSSWTRAVLLNDTTSTVKLSSQLPEAIRKTAGTSTGFPATLALLRNPGLRPYVEPGVSHLASYSDLDHFRGNWWCADWAGQFASDPWVPVTPSPAGFVTKEQLAIAQTEYAKLEQLPCAPAWLGRRVLEYAKTNPGDPNLPEALALTVRGTRYACLAWGAQRDHEQAAAAENTAVSKAAFQYLHAHFPRSPWTAKTKYYY